MLSPNAEHCLVCRKGILLRANHQAGALGATFTRAGAPRLFVLDRA